MALPLTLQPLAVNRPVSIETVNRALGADRLLFLVLQKNEAEDPGPDDLLQVGTIGVIRQMAKVPSGINIIIEGLARARQRWSREQAPACGRRSSSCRDIRAHHRGRSAHPPHPGTDREGAVAVNRVSEVCAASS